MTKKKTKKIQIVIQKKKIMGNLHLNDKKLAM